MGRIILTCSKDNGKWDKNYPTLTREPHICSQQPCHREAHVIVHFGTDYDSKGKVEKELYLAFCSVHFHEFLVSQKANGPLSRGLIHYFNGYWGLKSATEVLTDFLKDMMHATNLRDIQS